MIEKYPRLHPGLVSYAMNCAVGVMVPYTGIMNAGC